MAIRTLTELIMLRRAEEQCNEVLRVRQCHKCGQPVKKGSGEQFCARCRMNTKRRKKRELYGRKDRA
jgi:Zn finger protein HypA/HybF involved in hydrogenase expression